MKRGLWLLLIHRVPATPLYLRARIRTLLERAGAAPLKKAVYALPARPLALEALEHVAEEIRQAGGEAFVCEARFVSVDDETALRARHQALAAGKTSGRATRARPRRSPWVGRSWVTRRGILVDRIACAWLIRRFLDPSAKIRFADPPYAIRPGEVGFDMPGGEFSHEGGGCSFETLIAKTGVREPGLSRLAQIVHALDLRDDRFDAAEAAGVERVLAGIVAAHPDDASRLERGMALFDDLHRAMGRRPVVAPPAGGHPPSRRGKAQ